MWIQKGKSRIIFNCITPNPKLVQNLIVLAAKFYIYLCRCRQDKLEFKSFKLYIQNIRQIEKEIAVQNQRKHIHDMKWSEISLRI